MPAPISPPTPSPISITNPPIDVSPGEQETGETCSADAHCARGVCKSGLCFASASCNVVRHDGQPFNENKVNIVFVGSGFKNKAAWREQVPITYSTFEEYEPFAIDNDRFNVFYVDELADSFCHYFCNDIERLLCCKQNKARELSTKCFPTGAALQTIVIHNDEKYGGAGYIKHNIGTTSIHERGPLVAVHELGHSLFELLDEYSYGWGTDKGVRIMRHYVVFLVRMIYPSHLIF